MTPQKVLLLPDTRSGWLGLIMALAGLGSWVVLPVITSVWGDTYPVADSFLMPVIGLLLTALAAVINVLVVWRGHQRSVASLLAMFLTVTATLFFGLFIIGEGLAGA